MKATVRYKDGTVWELWNVWSVRRVDDDVELRSREEAQPLRVLVDGKPRVSTPRPIFRTLHERVLHVELEMEP